MRIASKRTLLRVAAALAALVVWLAIVAVFTLQSPWFYEKVRQYIVSAVETATGGRVEAASFHFDWKHLRAEMRGSVRQSSQNCFS